MPQYETNTRVKRLNEVFRELNYRSYNAFAADIGSNQTAVSNYIKGKRIPTEDFLDLVVKKYPQYNHKWLAYGEGDKFNREYVDINTNGHVIQGNNNGGDNIIYEKSFDEIRKLYNDLVCSLREQIEILKSDNEALHRLLDMKGKDGI